MTRLDPRAKLALVVALSVASLGLASVAILFVVLALELAAVLLSGATAGTRAVGRFLRAWCASLAVVSAAVYLLAGRAAAITFGVALLRITVLYAAGLVFAATTPPERLYDALRSWGLPSVVLVPLTVGLRFLPLCGGEVEATLRALKVRGIGLSRALSSPRLFAQALLVPVLARSFRLADEVAAAAMLRGFGGGAPRTALNPERWRLADTLTVGVAALLLVSLLTFGRAVGA